MSNIKNLKLNFIGLSLATATLVSSMCGCSNNADSHKEYNPKNYFNYKPTNLYNRLMYVMPGVTEEGNIILQTHLGHCYNNEIHSHYKNILTGEEYIGEVETQSSGGYTEIASDCQKNKKIEITDEEDDMYSNILYYLTDEEAHKVINDNFSKKDLIEIKKRLQKEYNKKNKIKKKREDLSIFSVYK